MSIKIAIAGFQGRIGQALCEQVWNSDTVELGAITHHAPLEWDVEGLKPTTADILTDTFDVLIDFTTPASMEQHLKACLRLNKPIVIGTTGCSTEQKAMIRQAAETIPVFLASNMSVGVNVLMLLAEKASRWLPEADAEIFEMHHALKKDAPSGTALSLGESVSRGRGQSLSEHAVMTREGTQLSRKSGDIGFSCARGGNVAGEHSVFFLSSDEKLTLSHQAMSPDIFASGALKVAQWIVSQPKGFYEMRDYLVLD